VKEKSLTFLEVSGTSILLWVGGHLLYNRFSDFEKLTGTGGEHRRERFAIIDQKLPRSTAGQAKSEARLQKTWSWLTEPRDVPEANRSRGRLLTGLLLPPPLNFFAAFTTTAILSVGV